MALGGPQAQWAGALTGETAAPQLPNAEARRSAKRRRTPRLCMGILVLAFLRLEAGEFLGGEQPACDPVAE
jgi:hypothetical protein